LRVGGLVVKIFYLSIRPITCLGRRSATFLFTWEVLIRANPKKKLFVEFVFCRDLFSIWQLLAGVADVPVYRWRR